MQEISVQIMTTLAEGPLAVADLVERIPEDGALVRRTVEYLIGEERIRYQNEQITINR
jgi:hypothetical protein